jgi:general secretion pathway protein L
MIMAKTQLMSPVVQILHWWLRELRACLPGARTNVPSARPRALIIRMGQDQAVFHYRKGRAQSEMGRLSLNRADGSLSQKVLASVRRKARAWRTDVVLCLQADCALRLKAAFPLATQDNLREVLGFEMERLTAFNVGEVYYSHRVIEVNQAEKRVTVVLTAVPRVIADGAMKLARSWGLKPDVVTVDTDDLTIDRTTNLLPKPVQTISGPGMRRVLVALLMIAIGLGAAAVHLEFRQQARVLAAYEARLAESRATGLHAQELRTEVSQLLTRTRYVAQRKEAQPLLSEILDEATRRLPDNTWVSQFQVKGNQLTLSGYSTAASALIEGLEASQMLSQVRFTSPITFDAKLGVERFNLSAAIATNGGLP